MAGEILVGDVRAMLRTLSAESISCVVTSPPYWSLRSYSTNPQLWGGDPACEHSFDQEPTAEGYTGKRKWQHSSNGRGEEQPAHKTLRDPVTRSTNPEAWSQVTRGDTCRHCGCWRGELGGEPTPDLYVEHIVEVFREVRRVLRRDGTCWVNLGDSYVAGGYSNHAGTGGAQREDGGKQHHTRVPAGLKPKDLVGIPWRVAFALQADGWYLRSDIIWSKPNPMPESVIDRPTKSHEYLFLLSRSSRYYYDADAVRESAEYVRREWTGHLVSGIQNGDGHRSSIGTTKGSDPSTGRNRRSVWEIPTQPTPEAHFATYPEKLVEPCILAGTSERGVCRQCGAPWRRVTESSYERHRSSINRTAPREHSSYIASHGEVLNKRTETTGWINACKHLTVPIPATVLDPFLGSGTTARVAERLGRTWVGIELNENYAEIARRRTAQRGLLQWSAGGAE